LMAVNIVLCKLWSRPPDPGLVPSEPEEDEDSAVEAAVRAKPFHAAWRAEAAPAEAGRLCAERLARAGFRVRREAAQGGSEALVATRHGLQRWGSYLAHVALVVMLVGALLKHLFGFVEMVPVVEGASRAIRSRPGWELAVDRFSVDYYEGTRSPKRFASELRLTDGGRPAAAATVAVNDPMTYRGVRFYQASWGAVESFRRAVIDLGGGETVALEPGRTSRIGRTAIAIRADRYLPDFEVTADGRASTSSLEPNEPALRISFESGPRSTPPLWLLAASPDAAFVEDADGRLARVPSPPFRVASVEPVLFSGIQAAYDPGYPVVLAGSAAWVAGMVLLFHLHRRRLWVLCRPAAPGGAGAHILLGGWSSRGLAEFRGEFDGLARELGAA